MPSKSSPRNKAAFLHQLISDIENAIERFDAVGYRHTSGILENILDDFVAYVERSDLLEFKEQQLTLARVK